MTFSFSSGVLEGEWRTSQRPTHYSREAYAESGKTGASRWSRVQKTTWRALTSRIILIEGGSCFSRVVTVAPSDPIESLHETISALYYFGKINWVKASRDD